MPDMDKAIETVRRHFAGTPAEAHYVAVMTRRAAWVILTPGGYWTGNGYGSADQAKWFSSWDDAVEAAQEDAELPAGSDWQIVAV
jgi:hypothetical protein